MYEPYEYTYLESQSKSLSCEHVSFKAQTLMSMFHSTNLARIFIYYFETHCTQKRNWYFNNIPIY